MLIFVRIAAWKMLPGYKRSTNTGERIFSIHHWDNERFHYFLTPAERRIYGMQTAGAAKECGDECRMEEKSSQARNIPAAAPTELHIYLIPRVADWISCMQSLFSLWAFYLLVSGSSSLTDSSKWEKAVHYVCIIQTEGPKRNCKQSVERLYRSRECAEMHPARDEVERIKNGRAFA